MSGPTSIVDIETRRTGGWYMTGSVVYPRAAKNIPYFERPIYFDDSDTPVRRVRAVKISDDPTLSW